MDSLVSVDWLHEHLNDPNLVVLDTTVQIDFDESGKLSISSGRDAYKKAHIPSAGFADLTSELVDTSSQYPYAIPAPERFANAMEALGVGDQSRVVLYANGYSAWAARVWWMLRWIGFDNAAVLDGGMGAWQAAGYPVSDKVPRVTRKSLTVATRPNLIADRDEVLSAISDDNVLLVDAMPEAHYRGEMVMYGRPGHIPTAINIPTVFSEDGHFLSDPALKELHSGVSKTRVITYCGGGISASANALALDRIGYTDIAVYINSLDEWASDPANPMNVVEE